MVFFPFLAYFISIFYFALILGAIYFIFTWVNKFIALRQEHNELLREILKKMDNKESGNQV